MKRKINTVIIPGDVNPYTSGKLSVMRAKNINEQIITALKKYKPGITLEFQANSNRTICVYNCGIYRIPWRSVPIYYQALLDKYGTLYFRFGYYNVTKTREV